MIGIIKKKTVVLLLLVAVALALSAIICLRNFFLRPKMETTLTEKAFDRNEDRIKVIQPYIPFEIPQDASVIRFSLVTWLDQTFEGELVMSEDTWVGIQKSIDAPKESESTLMLEKDGKEFKIQFSKAESKVWLHIVTSELPQPPTTRAGDNEASRPSPNPPNPLPPPSK